jgi:hypothetical protein
MNLNFVRVDFARGDYHIIQTNVKMDAVKIAVDSRRKEDLKDEDIVSVKILKPEEL